VLPAIPGDSFEINMDGIARLAPLRKEVVSESQVDLCVFYVPHRHVFDEWNDYLQEGIDTSITLPSFALAADVRDPTYLLNSYAQSTIPLPLVYGYNQIWDRYFRVPSLSRDPDWTTYPSTQSADDIDWRAYGRRCARLFHPVNDGIRQESMTPASQPWRDLDASDWEYDAVVSGGSATIDLRDLNYVKGIYKSEIERTWFSDRYTDLLKKQWGTTVNIDADQRPELMWRQTLNMSGHDVDGNDDATLGSYIGKTVARVGFNMPRKYVREHGFIWVMALIRHPYVHVAETHILHRSFTNTHKVQADPDIFESLAPEQWDSSDWIAQAYSGPTASFIDYKPWGNEYRMHCANIHRNFNDIPGYPFLKEQVVDLEVASYYQTGDYDDVFQTSQLAHWQIHSKMNVIAHRRLPAAGTSVYAGT
jgi:hypothetical protein